MDGYKIGDISYIYGLSSDAIRYYEDQGIIAPKRDPNSGYRYYTTWDINFLIDCLWYRSYDFSLSDIKQMMRCDNLSDFEARCRRQESKIMETITEQRKMLKQLSKMRKSISDIGSLLGKFSIEDSHEMVWQCQTNNQVNEKGTIEQGESAEVVREWVRHMAYLRHTFIMPSERERQQIGEYCWGFALTPDEMAELNLKMSETSVYIPSYKCIRTVFIADDEGTFMPCIRQQVLDPIKEQGFRITRPPFGNLLCRVHENGQMKRYIEVYCPIEY